MKKYRILEDKGSHFRYLRYVPQVLDANINNWKDLAIEVELNQAKAIIKAHQDTGTRYSIVWDNDSPEPAPRWWEFWK